MCLMTVIGVELSPTEMLVQRQPKALIIDYKIKKEG